MTGRFAQLTTITPELHYSEFLIRAMAAAGTGDRIVPIVRAHERAIAASLSGCAPLTWAPGLTFASRVDRQIAHAEIDLLHAQFEPRMYGGWLSGWQLARLLRKAHRRMPTVLTMHAVVPKAFFADAAASRVSPLASGIQRGPMWAAVRHLHRQLARHSDRVIVHLENLKATLVEDYGVPEEKVLVIPHGILPGPLEDARVPAGDLTMVAPGYVAPRKGLETLIEAVSVLGAEVRSRLRVLIAGYERNPAYGAQLRGLARQLGVERNVEFVGPFSRRSLHAMLSQARAVILPYALAYSASGPLALAAAYSVPVIAPTLPPFVEERRSGLGIVCFEAGNVEHLARSVEQLAGTSALADECRERMSAARSTREWSGIAEQTLAAYRSLL